jgi:hypothetical protein
VLGRAERLFWNDSPSRATAAHIAPLLKQTACSAKSQAGSAARVRSGCAARGAARAVSCAGARLRARWPRRALALPSPGRRITALEIDDTLTRNSRAAARPAIPSSTAAKTRARRASE